MTWLLQVQSQILSSLEFWYSSQIFLFGRENIALTYYSSWLLNFWHPFKFSAVETSISLASPQPWTSLPGKAGKKLPHHPPRVCLALWAEISLPGITDGRRKLFFNFFHSDTFICSRGTSCSQVLSWGQLTRQTSEGECLPCWVSTFPGWKVKLLKVLTEAQRYTLPT